MFPYTAHWYFAIQESLLKCQESEMGIPKIQTPNNAPSNEGGVVLKKNLIFYGEKISNQLRHLLTLEEGPKLLMLPLNHHCGPIFDELLRCRYRTISKNLRPKANRANPPTFQNIHTDNSMSRWGKKQHHDHNINTCWHQTSAPKTQHTIRSPCQSSPYACIHQYCLQYWWLCTRGLNKAPNNWVLMVAFLQSECQRLIREFVMSVKKMIPLSSVTSILHAQRLYNMVSIAPQTYEKCG